MYSVWNGFGHQKRSKKGSHPEVPCIVCETGTHVKNRVPESPMYSVGNGCLEAALTAGACRKPEIEVTYPWNDVYSTCILILILILILIQILILILILILPPIRPSHYIHTKLETILLDFGMHSRQPNALNYVPCVCVSCVCCVLCMLWVLCCVLCVCCLCCACCVCCACAVSVLVCCWNLGISLRPSHYKHTTHEAIFLDFNSTQAQTQHMHNTRNTHNTNSTRTTHNTKPTTYTTHNTHTTRTHKEHNLKHLVVLSACRNLTISSRV
jgi:hypothetical protein